MDEEGLIANDYLTQTYPSQVSDRNRNGRIVSNGSGSPQQSTSKELGSLSIISGQRKFDNLSSTFERNRMILGWENINVFVHRATGCFDRCLRPRGRRGNIEFIINQLLNEGNY